MTFLSETIASYADTTSGLLQFINTSQPILDFIVAIMEILGFLSPIVIWIFWKKLISPYFKFKSFVDSVYTQEKLTEISTYYIRTRAQDMDPCEQDEIRYNNGKYISCNLISFFIKDAFIKSSSGKYYLVLADSGMGKTTFLLRLLRECMKKYVFPSKLKVELVPLTATDCLDRMKLITNQENTILLLDALDENKAAINNSSAFLEDLIDATSGFNKIVITCRTQFFPSRKEEPAYTNSILVGRRNKKTEIVKKYLSPFTDEEVKLYLKKRFRFKFKLQKRAFEIVRKVPNIMARPLILNWINFLCDSKEDYRYSYQIYTTIIDKWIEREDLGNSERKLFELSRSIADYMFQHESTTIPAEKVEEIASKKEVKLAPIIAKSRSLLNRNGQGEYKFAHQTFLEYFIVFGIVEKMRIPEKTDFLWSLSGVKRFLLEILISSVEETDPQKLDEVDAELSSYRTYTGVNNLIEFIQTPKLQLSQTNNEIGFTLEAWQAFEDTTAMELDELLKLTELIKNDEGAIHKTVAGNRFLNVRLIFTVLDNAMPPHTTLELEIYKTRLDQICNVR